MKRITISLPDDMAIILERAAHQRSTSASDIARVAIAAYLGIDGSQRALPFVNLGRSGHTNTAQDAEEILAAEWPR